MVTASNAIKACIEDNWNPATGGTEPTVFTSAEDGMYPTTEEWIFLKTWEYGKKRKRRNDSFVKEDDYVGLRVHSMNHADKEERLDEMVTEVYRIVTSSNVTGYHKVDIIDQHRRGSDKRLNKYAADLTVELKILSTSSTATPGSTTTSTAEFDELTINTHITGLGLTITDFLDEDDMASDSAAALCSQQSIKKYVDDVILTEDTLAEMNDVTISAPADNEFLAYNNAATKWINQTRAEAGIADSDISHDGIADVSADDHHPAPSDAAYAAGWDTVTTIAPSKNAVYDKLNAMDTLIAANTTVTEVEAVITAEIVGGQSIDNAIDALILTHKNLATAHQDAPGLIATHAGDDDAHHAVFIPATTYTKHASIFCGAMVHSGSIGTWAVPNDTGYGQVARLLTLSGGASRYVEGGVYLQSVQGTTPNLVVWYVYEAAGTDSADCTIYACFHNDGDSTWNIWSAEAKTFDWVGNGVLKSKTFAMSDADFTGEGWFNFAIGFTNLDANDHHILGVTIEYVTDHA